MQNAKASILFTISQIDLMKQFTVHCCDILKKDFYTSFVVALFMNFSLMCNFKKLGCCVNVNNDRMQWFVDLINWYFTKDFLENDSDYVMYCSWLEK